MSAGRDVGDAVDDREATGGPQPNDLLDVGEEVARLADTLAGWWTSVTAGAQASGESARPAAAGHAEDRDADGGVQDGAHDDAADGPGWNHDGARAHHGSATGGSCRVCPLCRVLDVVRAAGPDLLTQVATAAETVALLLREAAAGGTAPGPRDPPVSEGTDLDGAGRRPPHGTPIVVRDVDEAPPPGEQQGRGTPWD
jgi:hypothetical protein